MNLIDYTAGEGDLELLVKLHQSGMRGTSLAPTLAARNGHMAALRHLVSLKYDVLPAAMDGALNGRYFDIVLWLNAECGLHVQSWMFRYADDDPRPIKFVRENDRGWSTKYDAIMLEKLMFESCPRIKKCLTAYRQSVGKYELMRA